MPSDAVEYPKDLVDELEELTKKRQFPSRDETAHTLQLCQHRIDEIVAELKMIPSPRRGDIIAGASLVRILGKGNFGVVWEAIDQGTGEPRAVKIFDSDRLGLGLSLYYFRRGVRAMAHLLEAEGRPRSIVRFYGATESKLAFAMQYIDGHDISNIAKKGWGLPKKLTVFRTVCEAVSFAHSEGILHRDLKPANIVLTRDEHPVLTDFDIADLLFIATLSTHASGTIAYAAPEQLRGQARRDASGDIYSLGRILHFLLIERDPDFVFEDIPRLAALKDFPNGLIRIIRRCTLRDPVQRYESVGMLLYDLERYDSDPGTVGVDKEGPAPENLTSELYRMLVESRLGMLFDLWSIHPTPDSVMRSRSLDELCDNNIIVEHDADSRTSIVHGGPPYRLGEIRYEEFSQNFLLLRSRMMERIRAGAKTDADRAYREALLEEYSEAIADQRPTEVRTSNHPLPITQPAGLLGAAIKAVPAVKWALGVGGVASVIAIIGTIGLSPIFAAVGTVVMLFLMTLLLLFARASTDLTGSLRLPALTLTWFFLFFFILTATMLLTGVFFEWPLSLKSWIIR